MSAFPAVGELEPARHADIIPHADLPCQIRVPARMVQVTIERALLCERQEYGYPLLGDIPPSLLHLLEPSAAHDAGKGEQIDKDEEMLYLRKVNMPYPEAE